MSLLIERWARTVRDAQAGRLSLQSGCPCCDGSDGLLARDRLEAIIRHGGRPGRRVTALVQPFDDGFRRATCPDPAWAPSHGRWWWGRLLDRW